MEQAQSANKQHLTLFEAVKIGSYEEFIELLKTEDVNQRGEDETTPLIELIYMRHVPDRKQKLEALLRHKDIEIDAVNSSGLTALGVATVCDRELVGTLLEVGANPNVMTYIKLKGGMKQSSTSINQWRRVSLLSAALNSNDTKTFELLQSYGADVNIVGDMDVSPLSLAAKANDVTTMAYLVEEAGAELDVLPVNWRDFTSNPKKVCGVTLRKALKHGCVDALEYLLNKGVEVPPLIYRSAGHYETPLTYLLSQPVWGAQKRLYDAAARKLFRWMRMQNNLASIRGEKPMYDLKSTDSSGRTALHYAVEGYSAALCQKLIVPSIIHKRDNNGATPFGLTVRRGALDILELLLKNGANPNDAIRFVSRNTLNVCVNMNIHNEPAIFYAMRHKNQAMAVLLIKYGANLLVRDYDNKRPEDYLDKYFSLKFQDIVRGITRLQEEKLYPDRKYEFARKYLKIQSEKTK